MELTLFHHFAFVRILTFD